MDVGTEKNISTVYIYYIIYIREYATRVNIVYT